MRFKFLFYTTVIYFFSCSSPNHYVLITEIRQLEFARITDSTAFDKFLEKDEPDIKMQIAKSIGKMQNNSFFPVLDKLIKENNIQIKRNTIFALGQLQSKESTNLLLKLLKNNSYAEFKNEIIEALGKSEKLNSMNTLWSILPGLDDSLKAKALYAVTFLFSKKIKNTDISLKIGEYLSYPSDQVQTAAAYFFSRKKFSSAINLLIRLNLNPLSLGNKYRYKAIDKILSDYYIPENDSALLDTLKQSATNELQNSQIGWQTKIYQISILGNFVDSVTVEALSKYLRNPNPHIRLHAINALGKTKSQFSKNKLLEFYNKATWAEKGTIIKLLAKSDKLLGHRLIQQNLDQGTVYFKQLLLESLAQINDDMAIDQLRQFLTVPEKRLKYTAFVQLDALNQLKYGDAIDMLNSGDMMLSTIAANWIGKNHRRNSFDDLKSAYQSFSLPDDIEPMLEVLKAIDSLRVDNSIEFLKNIYQTTSNSLIARQVFKTLKSMNVDIPKREIEIEKLFVPDTLLSDSERITAMIKTGKGNIEIELLPGVAPATVSNFVYLVKKGFYNGLTFHRFVSDFVVQGGDPRGDGWGSPGYNIPCEYNNQYFERGSVGMATAGKDTGGSQFFICHSEQPHLNGRYTNFGNVKQGMSVVDLLEKDDKIIEISILM